MENINKAAAAGVIFFMVILAGFVGIKVDQTTIALLGGAFIGIVIAFVTTMLIVAIARRPTEPAQPTQQLPPVTIHHHHYDNRRVVVAVNVPHGADATTARLTVSRDLRVVPSEAQRMIDAGEVQCLPAGR